MSDHIQMQVREGTDVGGWDISPPLREWLWPDIPEGEFVEAWRTWVRQRFFEAVENKIAEQNAEQVNAILDEGLTPID